MIWCANKQHAVHLRVPWDLASRCSTITACRRALAAPPCKSALRSPARGSPAKHRPSAQLTYPTSRNPRAKETAVTPDGQYLVHFLLLFLCNTRVRSSCVNRCLAGLPGTSLSSTFQSVIMSPSQITVLAPATAAPRIPNTDVTAP